MIGMSTLLSATASMKCPLCGQAAGPTADSTWVIAWYECQGCGHEWSARIRDGRPDLAVANQVSVGFVSILLGNGNATFQPAVSYPAGFLPHAVAVADFDRDGKQDLAVANFFDPGVVSILLGNGDGTFQTAVNYGAGVDPSALGIADFNRDGKLDLAVANGTDPGAVFVAAVSACAVAWSWSE